MSLIQPHSPKNHQGGGGQTPVYCDRLGGNQDSAPNQIADHINIYSIQNHEPNASAPVELI